MRAPTNLRGYTIERPLGKGGMGSVWVGRKLSTNQEFAIKFLKEEFLEDATYLARFEREVQALRSIRHPNVVNVFEWSMPKGDPDAKPYVVMELLTGEGLDRLLRRQRVLPPKIAVSILLQVLDGLAAAHNIGVVHRDLGPSNIHLTPQSGGGYLVRVLDFGLARPLTQDEADGHITQHGTLMGKPGYISPEALLGLSVDGRADLFGCGMILYRMLAGRLPYKETGAQFLWAERYAERTHENEYRPIRDFAEWVPEKLAMIAAKAVRRKPDERYQTAEDMQVDLLDIEDSVLARAGKEAPPPPPRPAEVTASMGTSTLAAAAVERSRVVRRWAAIGGGALAVAAIAVVLLLWGLGGPRSTSSAAPAPAADVVAAAPGADADPDVAAEEETVVAAVAEPDVVEDVAPEAPAEETVAAVVPDVPAEPETVLIVVVGVPEEAEVRIGDEVPEGSPPKIRVPRSEALLEVTVLAKGYEDFTEMLLPTTDRVVNVRLQPVRGTRPGGTRPGGRRDAGTGGRRDAGTSGGTGPEFPEFPEDLP